MMTVPEESNMSNIPRLNGNPIDELGGNRISMTTITASSTAVQESLSVEGNNNDNKQPPSSSSSFDTTTTSDPSLPPPMFSLSHLRALQASLERLELDANAVESDIIDNNTAMSESDLDKNLDFRSLMKQMDVAENALDFLDSRADQLMAKLDAILLQSEGLQPMIATANDVPENVVDGNDV